MAIGSLAVTTLDGTSIDLRPLPTSELGACSRAGKVATGVSGSSILHPLVANEDHPDDLTIFLEGGLGSDGTDAGHDSVNISGRRRSSDLEAQQSL